MADKEERILITKVSGDCRNLRFMDDNAELAGIEPGYYCAAYPHGGWEKITKRTCKTCKREKFLTGISRQEAIEVMARALCKVELNCKCVCDIKCGAWKIETKQAEAALNALLEGGK